MLPDPVPEWGILPCGAFPLRHARCGRHEKILIKNYYRADRAQLGKPLAENMEHRWLRTEEADSVTSLVVLHEEFVPSLDMVAKIPS